MIRQFFLPALLGLMLLPTAAVAEVPAAVYQEVDRHTVCIRTELKNGQELLGSGYFVAPNLVATVAHQVVGAHKVTVYLVTGDASPARTLYSNVQVDAAIIQVPATNLPGLPLASAPQPEMGEEVFTIGCPLDLGHTLTRGVVSNPDRQVEGRRLIQADLVINSGNSGGPLLNARGEVIGTVMGSWKNGVGLNFAVPVAAIREALQPLAGQAAPRAGAATLPAVDTATLPAVDTATSSATRVLDPALLAAADQRFKEGLQHLTHNELAEARKAFQEVVALNPMDHQAHTNLGIVLHRLGLHDQAQAALIKAISIDPNFAVAYLNLGMVYAEGLHNTAAARQAFLKYLDLDPASAQAKRVRSWLRNLD